MDIKQEDRLRIRKAAKAHCNNDYMLEKRFIQGAEYEHLHLLGELKAKDELLAEANKAHKIELSNYAYQADSAKRERDNAEIRIAALEQALRKVPEFLEFNPIVDDFEAIAKHENAEQVFLQEIEQLLK